MDVHAAALRSGKPTVAMLHPFMLRHRLRLLLLAGMVLAIAIAGLVELTYQESTRSLYSLASRGVARTAMADIIRRMLEHESAQRGYLITGRAEYLTSSAEVVSDIDNAIALLKRHYAIDPTLSARVKELQTQVAEKQSEVDATITMYNKAKDERLQAEGLRRMPADAVMGLSSSAKSTPPRWLELVLTNIGREKMDAVRQSAEALMAAEDRAVLSERAGIVQTLRYGRAGLHGLTLASLFALLFYVRKTIAMETAQQQHAEQLGRERDELEVQVRRRTKELTDLARHLQTVREDERGRLARELHDELGALLTAAKLDVARMRRSPAGMTPDQEQRLRHLIGTLDEGISLKRRIIEDLRPSSLSNLGLVAALEIQAREFGARANLAVHLLLDNVALSEAAQITVYRLVQESFTNVAKYATASEVTVSLQADGEQVRVAVEDNGCGFDQTHLRVGSHGLTGMRYRVEALGGELRIDSAPGKGTRVEARLPMAAEGSADALPADALAAVAAADSSASRPASDLAL